MFLIDCSRVNSNKTPIFAKEISVANDGGTIEYMGLLYKIIDFNRLNGYDETKIGLWNMKYEDFEEEYKKLDTVEDESNQDNEEIQDNISDNEIIGGDTEKIEIPSGEGISGDTINNSEISGDKTEIDINDRVISGDEEIEEGYYFNATIIGVNGANLVVQALEDEAITMSSDMFSFSLNEEDNRVYLIGQKIRIKYTGSIRESYPAQIDVLGIEIIE